MDKSIVCGFFWATLYIVSTAKELFTLLLLCNTWTRCQSHTSLGLQKVDSSADCQSSRRGVCAWLDRGSESAGQWRETVVFHPHEQHHQDHLNSDHHHQQSKEPALRGIHPAEHHVTQSSSDRVVRRHHCRYCTRRQAA